MNWAMDVRHDKDQQSKKDETREEKETIQILNEIREKLDILSVAVTYGKNIGKVGQILEVCGNLIDSAMSVSGLPSDSRHLVGFGGIIIDKASKAFETNFSEKYLKEVLTVLNEDKKISNTLEKWMEYTIELDAGVKAIFGVSPSSEKWNIFAKVCNEFCKHTSSGIDINEVLNLMKQGKYSAKIGIDVELAILFKLYDSISVSLSLADKIRSTLFILSLKPEDVKKLLQTLKLGCNLQEIHSSLFCQKFQGVLNPKTTSAREYLYVFRAVCLAYSYISLMDTVNVIQCSLSERSNSLKKILEANEGELKLIKSLKFDCI